MAGFNDLPNELILLIIESPPKELKLSTLCLVSHRLYKLVELNLHQSITIPSSQESFHRYLALLLERPAFGLQTCELSAAWIMWKMDLFKNIPKHDRDPSYHICISEQCHCPEGPNGSISRYQFPQAVSRAREKGMSDDLIHYGGCGGEIILLFHLLPNLKKLTLGLTHATCDLLGTAALGILSGGIPTGIQNIVELNIHFTTWHHQASRASLYGLMTIPALRKMRLNSECEFKFEDNMDMIRVHKPCYLEELELRGSELLFQRDDIQYILGLPCGLRRFSLITGSSRLDLNFTIQSLAPQSQTLEALEFCTTGHFMGTPLVSLRMFNRLKHLSTTACILFGSTTRGPMHTILPPSLAKFELFLDGTWNLENVLELGIINEWKDRESFPFLTEQVLRYSASKVLLTEEELLAVKRIEAEGIVVERRGGE